MCHFEEAPLVTILPTPKAWVNKFLRSTNIQYCWQRQMYVDNVRLTPNIHQFAKQSESWRLLTSISGDSRGVGSAHVYSRRNWSLLLRPLAPVLRATKSSHDEIRNFKAGTEEKSAPAWILLKTTLTCFKINKLGIWHWFIDFWMNTSLCAKPENCKYRTAYRETWRSMPRQKQLLERAERERASLWELGQHEECIVSAVRQKRSKRKGWSVDTSYPWDFRLQASGCRWQRPIS